MPPESTVIAVELQPSRCVLAAVRRDGDGTPVVLTASSIPNDEHLANRLRVLRRQWQLAREIRLVLWPQFGDPGVVPIAARPVAPPELPDTTVIHERAAALIQAGFSIDSVTQPHKVLAAVSRLRSPTDTIAMALERQCGCLTLARDGLPKFASYLFWTVQQPTGNDTRAALARYQFGALLAPHVHHLISTAKHPVSVFACGGLPDLRVQIVPLIEEIEQIDQEIDVLDDEFPGGVIVADELAEPALAASFQIAVAAAAN